MACGPPGNRNKTLHGAHRYVNWRSLRTPTPERAPAKTVGEYSTPRTMGRRRTTWDAGPVLYFPSD